MRRFAGLPTLAKLPALREFHLMGTVVTDDGLLSLAAVRTLATVQIGKTSTISASGIERLRKARPDVTVVVK